MDNCPICYKNKKLVKTECNHYFCINCLLQIDKCALCRKKLITINNSICNKNINYIINNTDNSLIYYTIDNHNLIVFSNYGNLTFSN